MKKKGENIDSESPEKKRGRGVAAADAAATNVRPQTALPHNAKAHLCAQKADSQMPDWDRLDLYDYDLPEELIAKEPLADRDASRLLVLDRSSGSIQHRAFRDLPGLLRPGDCLVLNDSRVLPARLLGRRLATGGAWEGLYLQSTSDGLWKLICQTRGKLQPGEQIGVMPAHSVRPHQDVRERQVSGTRATHEKRDRDAKLILTLLEVNAEGIWLARCEQAGEALDLLQQFGTVPLPPYIRRQRATQTDWERYQTEYARVPGSVAAPTAGLHFTARLRAELAQRGIPQVFVTLHVGIGTFRPVSTNRLSEHRMHEEWCELSEQTARVLRETRARGGRIVAVGTTTVRTLETVARSGPLRAWRGTTDLFIRPPYRFRAVDVLLTNFHLPRSTLLVLVCAFAGLEPIRRAYAEAVARQYRFYSYGDAMLIL